MRGDVGASTLAPLQTGILAGDLGEALDSRARQKAAAAEYRALESGQTGAAVSWAHGENASGNVVPQQPFSVGATDCRRYVHTIRVNEQTSSAAGTACRDEAGIWRPLS